MEKFTHGIIAVDPEDIDENDNLAIVHFIGLWNEPTKEQFLEFSNEINTRQLDELSNISEKTLQYWEDELKEGL